MVSECSDRWRDGQVGGVVLSVLVRICAQVEEHGVHADVGQQPLLVTVETRKDGTEVPRRVCGGTLLIGAWTCSFSSFVAPSSFASPWAHKRLVWLHQPEIQLPAAPGKNFPRVERSHEVGEKHIATPFETTFVVDLTTCAHQ